MLSQFYVFDFLLYKVPTCQEEQEKSQGIWVVRERSGKIFFENVRENKKVVPPDVRFLG